MGKLVKKRVVAALLFAMVGLSGSAGTADAAPEDKKVPAPKKAPAVKSPAAKPPAVVVAPPAEPKKPPLDFLNESLIERADGTVSYFYRTNFAAPADLITALTSGGFTQLLGPAPKGVKGNLRAVKGQNILVIDGEPEGVDMVLNAIAYFDVAAPQVFVEAKVIEVTYDSNFEFGVDYNLDRNTTGPNTIFRGTTSVLNPPSVLRNAFPPSFPFQGSELLFGLVGKKADKWGALDIAIQALQVNGKAEILSKPSIIATQGIKATVETREDRSQATLTEARQNDTIFKTLTYSAGVKLEVTPIHIGDAFVTLQIKPNVQGLAGIAVSQVGGTFAPIQTTRSAETTVTLADGETLVIGGLYTNTRTMERARTPFLSDVPFIGELFTRTAESKSKTELLFILTPHIVRKTKDLKIMTPPEELKRLEKAETKDKQGASKGWHIPPPPGWGARFEDDN